MLLVEKLPLWNNVIVEHMLGYFTSQLVAESAERFRQKFRSCIGYFLVLSLFFLLDFGFLDFFDD